METANTRARVMPETARNLRARAWAYVFACFELRKAKEDSATPAQVTEDMPAKESYREGR